MQSGISRSRYCKQPTFTLIGFTLVSIFQVPSQAGTPHPAPQARVAVDSPLTAPTPAAPASPAAALAVPDPKAQISVLKKAVGLGSDALKETSAAVEDADALQQSLQTEAFAAASLSSPAQITALNSVSSDVARVKGLREGLGKQDTLQTALTELKNALTGDAKKSTDDKVKTAVQSATAMQEAITKRLGAMTTLTGDETVKGSLTAAVKALSAAVKTLATKIKSDVDANPIITAATGNDRDVLSQNMGNLADLLAARARLRALIQIATPEGTPEGPLHSSLKAAGATDADLTTAADLSASEAETKAAAGLADRFQKLTQSLAGTGLSVPADVSAFAGRVQQEIHSGDTSNADVQQATPVLAQLRTDSAQLSRIVGAWNHLDTAWLQDNAGSHDTLAQADLVLADLTPDIALIADAADRIDEALSGDMNNFVTDQVRLFYFTDVERIMQALNSTVRPVREGQGNAQGKADQARQDLLDAEANVSQNLTAVNEAKTRLRTIQEDIRLIRARAADAQNRAKTANVLYNHLLQQQRDAKKPITAATAAGNTDLATQLTEQKTFSIDQHVSDAATVLATQKQQATSAQEAATQLDDESAALPQKLLDARSDLSASRQTLDRQHALVAGLAELEAQAFANGRDHAPYLRSDARALSTDPARRVILLGYPDSNTIFVRGLSKDVETVKDMIAEFDRPAPQARITLWTLQVNGTDPHKLASIMQDIDQHLLLTRTLTGLVQDRLRDSISYVVNAIAVHSAPTFRPALLPTDESYQRLLRYQFYQPEVLNRLGYDMPALPRGSLYFPSGRPGNLDELAVDDSYVTRFTLPDPAHATTLGEMLFVLSLGRKEYREAILGHFLLSLESIPKNLPGFSTGDRSLSGQQARLDQFTQGLKKGLSRYFTREEVAGRDAKTLEARMMFSPPDMADLEKIRESHQKIRESHPAPISAEDMETENALRFYPRFPETILGSFTDFGAAPLGVDPEELTANQNEILLAIQAQARENVANEIKNLLQRINSLAPTDQQKSLYAHTLRLQYLPLIGLLNSKYYSPTPIDPDVTWFQQGLLAVGALDRKDSNNLAPLGLKHCEDQLTQKEQGKEWKDMDQQAWLIASLSGQHNSLSRATPRVAAADDMIKRLIITIEDDLDYFFVQPELAAIRQETARKGIELGTFQRESLLATNRRVSRIDPRANADVELTGGTNFLEEASQLGQLYDRFRQEQTADKLTSSGPAALAGTLSLLGDRAGSALGVGAALSVLGDLFTQPQPAGEIYSINSGNLFKVTPIFDPSGQALRFQFDYAGTTDVREPDGTTNPSIPRVERHTVNTDVQLTNLELREVSRFEANSTLGTPEQRTGGLPLLKHLPILKDIPLIGYFARSAKKGAARQESLIFAQTSMYPTVADIVNLLVDIPPLSAAERTEPAYLTAQGTGKTATTSTEKPAVPQGGTKPVASAVAPPAPGRTKKAGDVSDFIMSAGMQPR